MVMSSSGDSLKVAVRVRPFNERERKKNSKLVISMRDNATTIANPVTGEEKQFTFDYSYWSHDGYTELPNGQLDAAKGDSLYADQKTVFDDLGKGVLQNAWDGYNATLFAYGQTGSGKSYSMIGYGNNKGIVPITCGELFAAIEKAKFQKELQVTFSMLEIYNEQIRDLLQHKSQRKGTNLKVREKSTVGFYVEGLSQSPCRDYSAIERLMEVGAINRTTASTNMNATSSRSHMVITIKFKQIFNNDAGESTTKTSEINLVDLAGSERADSTGATGDRLKEGSAINRSLLMLGSVIEKLASGEPGIVIPYRDSVLTKLLKSALGGNSKTVMIAALSPADINYDETLSTLRYANRAKKIKNKAVVNESPTDKLIRELKAENAKLLAQLSGKSLTGGLIDNAQARRLIAHNDKQMKEMMMTWEQKLESEKKKWEEELRKSEKKEQLLDQSLPYLQNVNEDPQLSGIIKHIISTGRTLIGRCSSRGKDTSNTHCIVLHGLGIQEEHCMISISDQNVTIEPVKRAEVYLNGMKILIQTTLQHGDRLKVGSNALFLYIGFPHERIAKNNENDVRRRYDYDFFQKELLSTSDSINGFAKDSPSEESTNPVYLEYIELMSVVEGVNAMSDDMGRNISFTLFVKNLATCDEQGRMLAKEVAIKVKHQVTHQIWIWSKSKFINRRYLIEELYVKHQDDPTVLNHLPKEEDPFWDPVEDVYLGCSHVWLHSLAYCMSFEDQVPILNHIGDKEGLIQVSLSVCSPNGEIQNDELMVIDPNELLGRRFHLIIDLQQCLGLHWTKENSTRGVMMRYKFYNEKYGHQSRAMWHSLNPKISMKQRITVDKADKSFLQYLHSAALVVELWGLQAGRIERPNSPKDSGIFYLNKHILPPPSPSISTDSSDVEALEKELGETRTKLEEINHNHNDLKKICSVLKKENNKLKTKLQKAKRKTPTKEEITQSQIQDKAPSCSKVQVELGRALKTFLSDVKPVQNNLRNLDTIDSPLSGQTIQQVSEELDHVLTVLKRGVANAVKIHKIERRASLT